VLTLSLRDQIEMRSIKLSLFWGKKRWEGMGRDGKGWRGMGREGRGGKEVGRGAPNGFLTSER